MREDLALTMMFGQSAVTKASQADINAQMGGLQIRNLQDSSLKFGAIKESWCMSLQLGQAHVLKTTGALS